MGKGHCRLDGEHRTEGNGQLERGKVKGKKDLCSLGMPYWELIKGPLINKINERRRFRAHKTIFVTILVTLEVHIEKFKSKIAS